MQNKKKRLIISFFLVIAISVTAFTLIRQPASTAEMRGHQVANEMGCFTCHGDGGQGGIPNYGALWGETVSLSSHGSIMSFIQNDDEIRQWILYGLPLRLQHQNTPSDNLIQTSQHDDWNINQGVGGLIKMPAYQGLLTTSELNDLVAFVKKAVNNKKPLPLKAKQGHEIATRLGCLGCHDSKRGKVSNPGSFKGYIPPWEGKDFAALVKNEEELKQWILKGNIDRYQKNPFASYFIKGQTIQMPAYENILQEGELDSIIEYIYWLRDDKRQFLADWVDTTPHPFSTVVERGKWLYSNAGCASCHSPAGRGGVPNKNSLGGYVPSLEDLADKIGLFEPKEIDIIISLFERGLSLDDPLIKNPLPYFDATVSEYQNIRKVILNGSLPGKKGSTPAMVMPAWKYRLNADNSPPSQADINAIIAYLLSLQPFENDIALLSIEKSAQNLR